MVARRIVVSTPRDYPNPADGETSDSCCSSVEDPVIALDVGGVLSAKQVREQKKHDGSEIWKVFFENMSR